MDKSATALQQLGQANEMKRRKKQALVWSVFSTILFVIAYIFPIGDALAGLLLLMFLLYSLVIRSHSPHSVCPHWPLVHRNSRSHSRYQTSRNQRASSSTGFVACRSTIDYY